MVYISGALKASRDLDRARALYERAAYVVREAGDQPYLPHQHTDPERNAAISPVQVFQRDLGALRSADAVLAFLSEPSLGVGAELALCAQAGTPMLGLVTPSDEVSRFAIGLLGSAGGRIAVYANTEELDGAVREFLDKQRAAVIRREANPPS